MNSLIANESFKARLLRDMKKVINTLADPDCEVIYPIAVDCKLIEVNEGKCWSVTDSKSSIQGGRAAGYGTKAKALLLQKPYKSEKEGHPVAAEAPYEMCCVGWIQLKKKVLMIMMKTQRNTPKDKGALLEAKKEVLRNVWLTDL